MTSTSVSPVASAPAALGTAAPRVAAGPEVRLRVFVLAAISLTAVVGLGLLYWLFVRTRWGQRLDNASRRARDVVPEDLVSDAWTLLDTISVASLVVVTAAIVAVALLRGRPALAAMVGLSILAANVATQLLKREILSRPDLIGAGDHNSFPSGHATVAMSVLMAVILVVPHRWRWVVATAGMAYPIGIGVGLVTAGAHRPSDVLGSWAVVLAVFTAALAVLLALRGCGLGSRRWPVATEVLAVGAVIVVGSLASLGVVGMQRAAAWLEDGSLTRSDEAVVVVASAAAITAGAVATVGLLVAALRDVSLDPPRSARSQPENQQPARRTALG
jgi:membrane-associated phospholipid phosphatase